jgi:hypothetical protein
VAVIKRFSLRSLLLATFSVCACCAVSLLVSRRNADEARATYEFSKFGATYTLESGLGKAVWREPSCFFSTFLDDVAVLDLSQDAWTIQDATARGITYQPISDKDLVLLEHFDDLRQLDLGGRPLTDECLKHIRQLSTLERLNIRGTQISEAGYRQLLEALPNCRISRNRVREMPASAQ